MERMIEFRLHGRGGQGIVVAASIFAEAVFLTGKYARAFSLFGAERRGAPVTAFIRVSEKQLMPRSRSYSPDYIVIFDATLNKKSLTAGITDRSVLIVNSTGREEELFQEIKYFGDAAVYTVDATAIARKYNLTIGSFPMVNTVMLGAMVRISGFSTLENLFAATRKRVSASIEANLKASEEGFTAVKEVERVAT
ncbi:MAG TPA: pyruvate ferredoxin oxidoreductase [Firmicutes bacterium]|nr:pyruvate ferredoxin oxidoreductase [Bacillota bacterium]